MSNLPPKKNRHKDKPLKVVFLLSAVFGCGGRTRTCDLQVMSLASYQLLHSAMLFFLIAGAKVRLFFVICKFLHDFLTRNICQYVLNVFSAVSDTVINCKYYYPKKACSEKSVLEPKPIYNDICISCFLRSCFVTGYSLGGVWRHIARRLVSRWLPTGI